MGKSLVPQVGPVGPMAIDIDLSLEHAEGDGLTDTHIWKFLERVLSDLAQDTPYTICVTKKDTLCFHCGEPFVEGFIQEGPEESSTSEESEEGGAPAAAKESSTEENKQRRSSTEENKEGARKKTNKEEAARKKTKRERGGANHQLRGRPEMLSPRYNVG